jgi:hypothetical protein
VILHGSCSVSLGLNEKTEKKDAIGVAYSSTNADNVDGIKWDTEIFTNSEP